MKKAHFYFSFLLKAFLVLGCQPLLAQTTEAEFLKNLHSGALLVRLQDRSASLKILEERGLNKQAEALRRKQYLENKETILSFENTFTFCPVYFFYAKDSESIRDNALSGVVFKPNQTPVAKAELPTTFYVAEFSETAKLGITGLVVMNENLRPLEAPLPYFERKYTWFGFISRSKAKMAKAYNQTLWKKYQFHFPTAP
jgi:hypothetical protein